MKVARIAAKWLLFATVIGLAILALPMLFGWRPFATQTGQTNIASAGPRLTELTPVDFACHVYGETRFIQTGLKEQDTTRVGIGGFGVDIGHGDTLSAFLAVVGQFEHCAEAADQRVWHDGQTLFAEVDRIRLNRPALSFGDPTGQDVPSCSSVLRGDAAMRSDPAGFEQTHYLCTGGITLDQGESATFYQTLQAYAEYNVGQSQCAEDAAGLFLDSITKHYQLQAQQLGLQLTMVGLDEVVIDSVPATAPPTMANTEFTMSEQEICVAG